MRPIKAIWFSRFIYLLSGLVLSGPVQFSQVLLLNDTMFDAELTDWLLSNLSQKLTQVNWRRYIVLFVVSFIEPYEQEH